MKYSTKFIAYIQKNVIIAGSLFLLSVCSSSKAIVILLLTLSFNFSFAQTVTYDPPAVAGQIDLCVGGTVTVTISGVNNGDQFSVSAFNAFPASDVETATGASVVLGPFLYSFPGTNPLFVLGPGFTIIDNVTVFITSDPVAPTLNLSEPEGNLQAGTPVSILATVNTAGSGGVPGSVDVYEYSTDNGTTWIPYTLGDPLSTTEFQIPSIQIRSSRSHPDGLGCYDENIYTWTIDSRVHDVTGVLASYFNIQEAIDAASTANGDVLEVDAGTYFENVTVDKALTIEGPQKDVDPRTAASLRTAGSAAEAIVDGNGNSSVFEITASNVILNGFEITNGSGDLISSTDIAPSFHNGVEVKYCIVHNSSGDEGIQLRSIKDGGVQYNLVYDVAGDAINMSGDSETSFVSNNEISTSASDNAAIYLYGNGPSMLVDNNLISGITADNGIMIGNKGGQDENKNSASANNAIVSNNIVTGHAGSEVGIYINTSRVNVINNTITAWESSSDAALYLRYDITDIIVTENIITGNENGVKVSSGVSSASASTLLVNDNNISGNTIDNLKSSSSGTVDATCNWHGDTNPLNIAAAITGNFEFLPFLSDGADDDGSTPGFQSVPGSCTGVGPVVVYDADPNGAGIVQSSHFTIQEAIDASTNGNFITVASGTYDEQVLVNREVALVGVGATQPVVNFTGTVSGKTTLFDVSQPNVTIENFELNVDLTKLHSGIVASGSSIDNTTVKDNIINATGSSSAANLGGYGDRNAVSINYGGSTNYRVATGGVNNIVFEGNIITGTTDDGFGEPRFFRSGISTDESGGSFTNNTILSINHDILARFGSNGTINITNNNLNGGGLQLSDMNAGAGTLTVSGNTFDGSFSNTYSNMLRLQNNYNSIVTNVSNNTFSNTQWAVSLENYNQVTFDNNTFTPVVNTTTYNHILVNTKSISSNSNSIVQVQVDGVFTNNTFNGSGTVGGAALVFANHDSDNADIGTFTIGTTGNENTFNTGIATFVRLDDQIGSSDAATFPGSYGSGGGWTTAMACWTEDMDISNNRYDVGSGLVLPSAMDATDRGILEGQLYDENDNVCLGELIYFLPVTNLTQAGQLKYLTISEAIVAAVDNDVLELAEWTFDETLVIDKPLTLQGASTDKTMYVLDGATLSGTVDGISIRSADVTLANLTIQNHSNRGIHAICGSSNLVFDNITADGNAATGIALNGGSNLDLKDIMSSNNGGNGLNFTDCSSIVVDGITTSGNEFSPGGFNAGIGLFTDAGNCPGTEINGFELKGTVSIAEDTKVYSQKKDISHTITGITGETIDWAVGVGDLDRFYWDEKATAYAVVNAVFTGPIFPNTSVYVVDVVNENFYVDDNPAGSATPMLINTAIDFIQTGNTIFVESGMYDENIIIDKALTIAGPNANIACGSRVAEAIIAPAAGLPVNITADGVTLSGFEVTAPNSFNAIALSNRSNVTVSYNNIHDIGTNITGAAAQNLHAIVNQLGSSNSSNVIINNNCLDNIGNSNFSNKSLSAIGVLDSGATGVLTGLNITDNTITNLNVNTASWPTGKIAYGIQVNVGGGSGYLAPTAGKVVNATISGNTISDLEGFISTGIGLEGNTENALVSLNTVSNLTGHKLANRAGGGYDLNGLKFENNRFVGTITVENNSFEADTYVFGPTSTSGLGYAVANYVPSADGGAATLNCNWFGTANYDELVAEYTAFTGKIFTKEGAGTQFIEYLTNSTIDTGDPGYSCAGVHAGLDNLVLNYTEASENVVVTFETTDNSTMIYPIPGLDPTDPTDFAEIVAIYNAFGAALASGVAEDIEESALNLGDDIFTEYYYYDNNDPNTGNLVYLQTAGGNELIKNKYFDRYLNNTGNGDRYPNFGIDPPSLPNFEVPITGLSTSTNPNTGGTVNTGWLAPVLGKDLYVTVTLVHNGNVQRISESTPIGLGPVNVYSAEPFNSSTLVSSHYTIQAANDAASTINGYYVEVIPGNLAGNVNITKELNLVGANAGVACDGSRGAESVLNGAGTTITIASDNVSIDGFTITGDIAISSVGVSDVSIRNNIIETNEIGISAVASASPYGIENNCITLSDQTFAQQTFDSDPTLAATQAPATWYVDRYAPNGFISESFDGDSRLKHSIVASDQQSVSFQNTQGRKYDTENATSVSIELYVPAAWATSGERMAGFWTTAVDAGNTITQFPIIEFTSLDGTPRFRVWPGDPVAASGWQDIGLPSGFVYDEWYTLSISIVNGTVVMNVGDLNYSFATVNGSTNIDNVILQGYNQATGGATYDIYWDNFKVYGGVPTEDNRQTTGIALVGAGGSNALTVLDNNIDDAYYGYLVNNVNTTTQTVVAGGEIAGVMQGVALVNTLDGVSYSATNLGVENVIMNNFTGDYTGNSAFGPFNFHAGVYSFTGGGTTTEVTTIDIDNVTIDGTGLPQQNSAAVSIADFSTASTAPVQVVSVTNSTITNNDNRGVDARGFVDVTVTENTFTENGADAFGASGNPGFTIIAQVGAQITASLNAITHPGTSNTTVTALYTGNAPSGNPNLPANNSLVAFENSILMNGNPDGIGTGTGANGSIVATCNWWDTEIESTIASLVTGNATFIPYLVVDNTLGTSYPWDNTDDYSCIGSLPVNVYSDAGLTNLIFSYATLQEANDAASTINGYYVEVIPGNLAGNVNITKELNLVGANAGVACDGSRGAESVLNGAGTTITISADNVSIDGFTITGDVAISSGVGRTGVTIQNNIINANETGISASGSTAPFTVQNNCVTLSDQTYAQQTFGSNPILGASQAAATWYIDRYAPNGFASEVFDGDDRLKHSIVAADQQPGSFQNTQGRKYDTENATSVSIELYVPAAWATSGERMAGFWGTGFDPTNAISLYPIIEFTSDGGTPRFRVWPVDATIGGWVDLGLPSGFVYDEWYTLTMTLVNGEVIYSIDNLTYSLPDNGTTSFGNVILQGYNFATGGATYDIYWDNFKVYGGVPTEDNRQTTGIALVGAGGSNALTVLDNNIDDAYYGYLVNNVNTTTQTVVAGGEIAGVMQGVALVNTLDGVSYSATNLGVENVIMNNFTGDYTGNSAFGPFNFHAGVYSFTGGGTTTEVTTIDIDNVTIDGTGLPQQNSAAVSIADFSTASTAPVQVVSVTNSTITNNDNRGVDARGFVDVTVTENTFTENGADAFGASGNPGFTIIAQVGAQITASLNAITHPGTSNTTVTALYTGNAPSGNPNLPANNSLVAFENSILMNGNPDGIGTGTGANGSIVATCNWWDTEIESTIASLVTGNATFIPYLVVDNTLGTSYPWDNTDDYSCIGSLPVNVYSDAGLTNLIFSYATLQEANDAASTINGYYVEVIPGNLAGNVNITKELNLVGANAGVACDGSRGAESVLNGAGTTITISADNVSIDGFTITGDVAISSGVGRTGVTIQNNIINANETGISASGSTAPFTVQNNCVTLSDQTYAQQTFGSNPILGASQAAATWYIDRYAPNGFASEVFDGDDRLKHSIVAADQQPGSFQNTQGRKYDTENATSVSIELYVPAAWATSGERMAGFWGTGFDPTNAISLYPIIEFTSDGGTPRFRVWPVDATIGGWVDLGLPSGFVYDEWYTLTMTLVNGEVIYSIDNLTYSLPDNGTTSFGNVILQGYNFATGGATYDIYWDNFKVYGGVPTEDNRQTTGIALVGAGGSNALTVLDNNIDDAYYGYLVNNVNTTTQTVVAGGEIAGVMQGVALVNTLDGVSYSATNLGVENVIMNNFTGDYTGNSAFGPFNFHAGVYSFTGGGTTTEVTTIDIDNVTIDGTGLPQQNSAAVSIADFSTASTAPVQVVSVTNSTITNNDNRGVDARGFVDVTVTENTFTENGADAFGASGNPGFTIIAQVGAQITASLNAITHPGTSNTTVTALYTGNAPSGNPNLPANNSLVAFENSILMNGNPDGIGTGTGANGSIVATCNWWDTEIESTIASLVTGNATFIPYLVVDNTLGTSYPWDNTDDYSCIGSLPVNVYSDAGLTNLIFSYATLQEANDAASTINGYYVEVIPGNLAGNVNITKELNLVGANAGVACDGSRGAESVLNGAGTTITISADNVSIDGFTITGDVAISSGVGRTGVTIQNNIINANETGISASGSTAPFTVQNNCVTLSDQTYAQQTFGSNPILGASQAAATWYIDRYAPNGFASEVFDGDDRLKHSIVAADQQPGSFQNTQGRKYDTENATSVSIELYVPAAWATSGERMAGFWGTGFDPTNAISLYPIIEFTSDGGTPRFRVWPVDATIGGWVDLGLPSGFVYDEWYTLTMTLVNGEVIYSIDNLTYSLPDNGTTSFGNVILQGYNFATGGATYDIYWDNFKVYGGVPTEDNRQTTGIALVGAGGSNALTVLDNNIDDAYYGYLVNNVNTTTQTVVAGGEIAGVMQGVALVNTLDGVSYSATNLGVENVIMNNFTGDYTGNSAFGPSNFHAGVYSFTGGGTTTEVTTIDIDNVTIDGTGSPQQNSAAVSIADFSTASTAPVQVVSVTNSTITNNDNRGVDARGNVIVTVTGGMWTNNGSDAFGSDGNLGFSLLAQQGATINATGTSITLPSSSTTDVFGAFTGNGTGNVISLSGVLIDGNNNADSYGVRANSGSTLSINTGSEVRNSSIGVLVNGGSATIENNSITDNEVGIRFQNSGVGTVNYNNITGNNTLGVDNTTAGIIDATLNWWGNADGPSTIGFGNGDQVSSNVTYCPWLDAEVSTGTPVYTVHNDVISVSVDLSGSTTDLSSLAATSVSQEFCESGSISITQVTGTTSFSDLKIDIVDVDNLIGGSATTYDGNASAYELLLTNFLNTSDEVQTFMITLTPFTDSNNDNTLNATECFGEPITVNVTLYPTPVLTAEVNDVLASASVDPNISVCDGEDVVTDMFDYGTASGNTLVSLLFEYHNVDEASFAPESAIPLVIPANTFESNFGSVQMTLTNAFIEGTLIVKATPIYDVNGNGVQDGEDICSGEEVTVTINVNPNPQISYTVNGTTIGNVNDGAVNASEDVTITVCDVDDNLNGSLIDAFGNGDAAMTVTIDTYTNIAGAQPADQDFRVVTYNAGFGSVIPNPGTVRLDDPNLPGQIVTTTVPYHDADGDGVLDAGECTGEAITVTINVNPNPQISYTVNGITIGNVNDGAVNASEDVTITVCDVDDNLNGSLIDAFGNGDAAMTVTIDTYTNIAGAQPADQDFRVVTYNAGFGSVIPNPGTVRLDDPNLPGQIVTTTVPYHDADGDGELDAGECTGEAITVTINVNPNPAISYTVNGTTVGNINNGSVDASENVTITVCDVDDNLNGSVIDANGNADAAMTVTINTYTNIAGAQPADQDFRISTYNGLFGSASLPNPGTVRLDDPNLPGQIVTTTVPYHDADGDGELDAGECTGEAITVTINVNPNPAISYTVNGTTVGNINNGSVDASENVTITVCDVDDNLNGSLIDANGNADAAMTVTINTYTNIAGAQPADQDFRISTYNGLFGSASLPNPGTVRLDDPNLPGQIVTTTVPYHDADGDGELDAGECTGEAITVTINVNPNPAISYTVNGTTVGNINNGSVDASENVTITVCDVDDNLNGSVIDANGNADAAMTVTINTYTNIAGAQPADQDFRISTYNGLFGSASLPNPGTVRLDDPNLPGQIVTTTVPYHDANANGVLDAGECTGEAITVTINVNPEPAISYTVNGTTVGNINNGSVDASENVTITVCDVDDNLNGSVIDANGNADAAMTVTINTYTNIAGAQPADQDFRISTYNGLFGSASLPNPGTVRLDDPNLPGQIVTTTVPYHDADGDGELDAGECTGEAITVTINVNPEPAISYTVNGTTVGNINNGSVDASENVTITVCDVDDNLNGSVIDANGNADAAMTVTIDTYTNIAGAQPADQDFRISTYNGLFGSASLPNPGTVRLDDPNLPGQIVTTTVPYHDADGDGELDAGECTGEAITVTINITPIATIDEVADQLLCPDDNSGAIVFTGSVAGVQYNWTNDNPAIGLASSGTGDIATFVATNATTQPITATISVTPLNSSGGVDCEGAVEQFTITVLDGEEPELVCPENLTASAGLDSCSTQTVTYDAKAYDPQYFEGFDNVNFALNTPAGWNEFQSTISRITAAGVGPNIGSGYPYGLIDNTIPGIPNTGLFSRLGGYSSDFGDGFRVRQDVYIDLADPAVLADTYGWDLSSAVNDQAGNHRRDFIFHTASNAAGNVLVAGSNNTNFTVRNDLATLNHYEITATGWYTFEFIFRDAGDGTLAVDLNLKDAAGTILFTEVRNNNSGPDPDVIATEIGGNRYLWFTVIAADYLAIDNTQKAHTLVPTFDLVSGSEFFVGETTVTASVTDECGDEAECTFTVTITDDQAPVFQDCPAAAVACNDDQTYTWTHPSLLDNCTLDGGLMTELAYTLSGATTKAATVITGYDGSTMATETLMEGITTVTYMGIDSSGNVVSNTCSFDIEVEPRPAVEVVYTGPATNVTADNSVIGNEFDMTICSRESITIGASVATGATVTNSVCGELRFSTTITDNTGAAPATSTIDVPVGTAWTPDVLMYTNINSDTRDVIYVSTPYHDTNDNDVLDAGDRVGVPYTFTLSVDPEPVGVVSSTEERCSATEYTLRLDDYMSNIVDPTDNNDDDNQPIGYSWEITDIRPIPTVIGVQEGDTGIGDITHTVTNPFTIVETIEYTITPTSENGCVGTPFVVNVNINGNPAAGININGAPELCQGGSRIISGVALPPGVYDYEWKIVSANPGNASIANSNASSATLTAQTDNANDLTIRFIATIPATGCGDSTEVTFTIGEGPSFVAGEPMDLSACEVVAGGLVGTFDLTAAVTAVTSPQVITYHTSASDAENGTGALLNPTNYTATTGEVVYVRLSDNDCYVTDDILLTVFPQPFVDITAPTTTCANGGPVTLSASPSGGVFSGSGMTGSVFDPAVAGVGTHTITYMVTGTGNCDATGTVDIEVVAAETIVTNTNDSGPGSLRAVMASPCVGDTIFFAASLTGSTIALTSGEIIVSRDVVIMGLGSGDLTLSGNTASRIFNVPPGIDFAVNELSMVDGFAATNGGAILNAGSMILNNVTFRDNREGGVPKALTALTGATLTIRGTVMIEE